MNANDYGKIIEDLKDELALKPEWNNYGPAALQEASAAYFGSVKQAILVLERVQRRAHEHTVAYSAALELLND